MPARPFAHILAVFLVTAAVAPMARADRLTEENMTRRDFNTITETESSVSGERAVEKPFEVHDFSEATENAVKEAHGVRVVKGKDWKKMTPQERDARMRELDRSMAASTFFMVEVPSGNVWAIDQAEYFRLREANSIHRWSQEEIERLPRTVPRDKKVSQSDKRGTVKEPVAKVEQEP